MDRLRRVGVVVALAAGVFGAAGCGGDSLVSSPAQEADAERGRQVFEASCMSCHGEGARGTATGPPLVDRIYEPSHHGDAAFVLAVRNGSPAHHWNFGDMPPVPGVDDRQIADVTAYVRKLQVAAGIR